MSEWRRFPVTPETITVLGNRVKDDSPMWKGLNLERADLIVQSTIMMLVCGHEAPFDMHLSVPFCHPDDQTGTADDWNDCYYRVRPRMKPRKRWKSRMVEQVFFERLAGEWNLAVAFQDRKRMTHHPATSISDAEKDTVTKGHCDKMNDAHTKNTHEPKDPAGNHFPSGRMGAGGQDHEARIAALEDFKSFVLRHLGEIESHVKAFEKDIARLEKSAAAQRTVNEALLVAAGYLPITGARLADAIQEALK